jgi:hypothetical protein
MTRLCGALPLCVLALVVPPGTTADPPTPPDWSKHPENCWVRQSPRAGAAVPAFLYEGSGDYDPFTRRWVHHAGHDGIPQGCHTFLFDPDTARWTQVFPPGSPPGVCCVDGGHVFDAASRRFVRFPGGMLGHGFQWSRGEKLKDSAVWLYDPAANTWANMRPPPYREPEKYSPLAVGGLNSSAAYDPNHEVVFSFGGQGAGGGKNTLFAYDTPANAFYHLKAENPPSARDGAGLAYDAAHDRLVMFGSQYAADERTWLYDPNANRWEGLALDPHPPAVKATKEYSTIPRMAYDPVNRIVLCVVWLGDRGHETWAFDTGKRAWTRLNPSAEPDPSKSRSRNLGYDPTRNVFILETSGAKSNRPEMWTYRYKAAGPVAAPVVPVGFRAAPVELHVVTAGGGKAAVNWVTEPIRGVDRYELYRGTGDEPWKVEFSRVGPHLADRFQDTGLQPGRVYTYMVKAVGADGTVRATSTRVRTQPRVPAQPVVSVIAKDRVEVAWERSAAPDVVGYNLYRGVVSVRTVTKGNPGAWRDNDPEYPEPVVCQVRDITGLKKLNDAPLTVTTFADAVDLTAKGADSADYRFAVYAYVVRAVNRLGVESGPSPYALTIPSEPRNVLCREHAEVAELRWDAARESGVAGYHVYRLEGTWKVVRLTEKPLSEPTVRHKVGRGETRFWVTTVDAIGQEGQPSSPAWFNHNYRGFYDGEWHQ